MFYQADIDGESKPLHLETIPANHQRTIDRLFVSPLTSCICVGLLVINFGAVALLDNPVAAYLVVSEREKRRFKLFKLIEAGISARFEGFQHSTSGKHEAIDCPLFRFTLAQYLAHRLPPGSGSPRNQDFLSPGRHSRNLER
jgi:hypothetical protein